MTRYAMIINLHDCIGCGACDIACKIENQVPDGAHFCYHLKETKGTFPNVEYSYKPVMCNHCANAACVKVCPQGAMHKDEYGLTVIDSKKCIGCGSCSKACPYHSITSAATNTAASDFAASKELIAGCTSSGEGVQSATKSDYPYHDPALDEYGLPMTHVGASLKCQMCKHLVYHGDVPRCVDACPAGARIFGDEEDIYGEVHKLKLSYEPSVNMPEAGTEPHVYYIREFGKTW